MADRGQPGEDSVFKALADPSRRKLLDVLQERDGRTLTELCEQLDMTRFGTMKHLRLLEEAGLITTRRVGREKFHFLNPVPIRLIHDRWIGKYAEPRIATITALKAVLEGESAMSPSSQAQPVPRQVYQIYIKASPERIWEAITRPEIRSMYFFGSIVESTFEPGSPIRSWSPDRQQLWGDNLVLESDPPRRLVHGWRSLYDEELAAEAESRVTWEIEPQEGGYCRLVLTHDQLEGAPRTAQNVSGGWMYVLSGMKTVIETGEPLSPTPR